MEMKTVITRAFIPVNFRIALLVPRFGGGNLKADGLLFTRVQINNQLT